MRRGGVLRGTVVVIAYRVRWRCRKQCWMSTANCTSPRPFTGHRRCFNAGNGLRKYGARCISWQTVHRCPSHGKANRSRPILAGLLAAFIPRLPVRNVILIPRSPIECGSEESQQSGPMPHILHYYQYQNTTHSDASTYSQREWTKSQQSPSRNPVRATYGAQRTTNLVRRGLLAGTCTKQYRETDRENC